MRNRTFFHTMIGGLVLGLVLFIQAAPGLAQTRIAAMPGDGQVTLSWGPVQGASSYKLSFAEVPDFNQSSPGFTELTGVTSPITRTGLANGTTYFFVITAITAEGEKPVASNVPSVPSANVTAALAGANAFFGQVRSVLNAHASTSDLANSHVAPFLDAAFLNEGRNGALEAKRMAQEMRGAAIDSLVIDHVNFYDEVNQIISIGGTVTMDGMSEFVGGRRDGFFILKRQADNTTWLSYGDQRIAKADFQIEMRTDRFPFGGTGPRQHVNFDIEAPVDLVSSVSVSGPGLASPLQLQKGTVRVETIVGDPAQPAETFYRDAFHDGFDPGTPLQSGTTFTVTLSKTAGGTAEYPVTFHGNAVTDTVAGAIDITNPTGHALSDAHLGSPLSVQWTLPTAYTVALVSLDGWVNTGQFPQGFQCHLPNQDFPGNATSGTITIPALCNSEPVVHGGIFLRAEGANGERSVITHQFSNMDTGGGTTTTVACRLSGMVSGAQASVCLTDTPAQACEFNIMTTMSAPFMSSLSSVQLLQACSQGDIVISFQSVSGSPGGSTTTTTGSTTTTSGSTTTTTGSTTTTTQGGTGGSVTLNFVAGWNLVGNSIDAILDVATAFADTTKVSTVWKWVASKSSWAFYTPTLSDGGAAYASGKGYDFLSSINGGEGFWVNAKNSFSAQLPSGSAMNSAAFQSMAPGWNLIAVGDSPTPSGFNKTLSLTPPSAGDIPLNVTTLWAWDSAQSNWYFYAPSLEKNGGLSAYIQSKNYLDFGTNKLDPAMGFWVNKPQ